jgi:hypothetical protein
MYNLIIQDNNSKIFNYKNFLKKIYQNKNTKKLQLWQKGQFKTGKLYYLNTLTYLNTIKNFKKIK